MSSTPPPPLTVTASSSPTDDRRRMKNTFGSTTTTAEEEREYVADFSAAEALQSRISDNVEIPVKKDVDVDNENNDDDDDDDVGLKKGQDETDQRREGRRGGRRGGRRNGLANEQRFLLKWHKEYSDLDVQAGRVLVIDYARGDGSRSHFRKVSAQEIFNRQGLHRFYRSQDPNGNNAPAMRLIHVQNADWAIPFLLRKFNIVTKLNNNDGAVNSRSGGDGGGDSVSADFGRYLRYKNPEIRGGKPFLAGKTWKVQYDPWREVNKTSFGLDYIKSFRVRNREQNQGQGNNGRKRRDRMMQLNDFDDDDEPICGHDVHVQRLSCYIQHKQAPSENRLSRDDLPPKKHFYPPDVYGDEFGDDRNGAAAPPNGFSKDKPGYNRPGLRNFDNGNVIIIFDNSSSGNIDDTLIPARRDLECRWRRLPFHLAFESRDPVEDDDDAKLALNCSKSVLSDIFKSLVLTWDGFLDRAVTHMTILEDKIYDRPDDESRAPELWANSSAWLKVEKLVNVHISVMHEMKMRLHELTDDIDTEDNWLDDSPGDFERLTNLITEDLTKPTESLISLLYQSVSIRDSRHSLELGVSMWRLSWITFIFLPLTFIVGFFGMNVDTFQNNPSIKWYFIAAIPFMCGVVAFYFFMKGGPSDGRRRSPHERAVYESFFHEMADRNPALWSRNGPKDYVRIKGGVVARLKWALIKYWLRPMKMGGGGSSSSSSDATATVATTTTSVAFVADAEDAITGQAFLRSGVDGDGLEIFSRIKRFLSKRWTDQLSGRELSSEMEMGLIGMNDDEFSDIATASGDERLAKTVDHHSIGDGLTEIAEILAAPAVPKSGQPGLSSSTPSSLDHERDHEHEHEHEHRHEHEHEHDDREDPSTILRTHLMVPGASMKSPRTTTAALEMESHQDDHDTDNTTNTTEIPNPVIAAAIARERVLQRVRSNSSPSPFPSPSPSGHGRGRGSGGRGRPSSKPRSSGSAGRNSNSDRVLVEEEDAEWLNERGRKGKDWFWRRSVGSVSGNGNQSGTDEGSERDDENKTRKGGSPRDRMGEGRK